MAICKCGAQLPDDIGNHTCDPKDLIPHGPDQMILRSPNNKVWRVDVPIGDNGTVLGVANWTTEDVTSLLDNF